MQTHYMLFFPKPDNSSEGTLNCLNISQQNTFLLLGAQSFHVYFGWLQLPTSGTHQHRGVHAGAMLAATL